ncbi:MAG TPA: class I SAM-dependent methyltransferase [Opitutaceae bacterium]|jgi:SAM-dependent methyltransferase
MTLDVPSLSFFGRTLAEYLSMFALGDAGLADRRILDVAAGPASFTAEACAAGIEVTAVDPLYGLPHDALAGHVQADYARMIAALRARPSLLRFKYFPSIDAAEGSRRAAAARFLADYEGGFVHGRYVGGALPRLPFADRSFDLVLCAHLLFVYAARFDYDWHVRACRELARVAEGEARIHPICGLDGRPYAELDRLQGELDAAGIRSEIVPIDYEFFAGSGSYLSLRR